MVKLVRNARGHFQEEGVVGPEGLWRREWEWIEFVIESACIERCYAHRVSDEILDSIAGRGTLQLGEPEGVAGSPGGSSVRTSEEGALGWVVRGDAKATGAAFQIIQRSGDLAESPPDRIDVVISSNRDKDASIAGGTLIFMSDADARSIGHRGSCFSLDIKVPSHDLDRLCQDFLRHGFTRILVRGRVEAYRSEMDRSFASPHGTMEPAIEEGMYDTQFVVDSIVGLPTKSAPAPDDESAEAASMATQRALLDGVTMLLARSAEAHVEQARSLRLLSTAGFFIAAGAVATAVVLALFLL